jgi:hypothetical protein
LTETSATQANVQPQRKTRDIGQLIGGLIVAFAGVLALPDLIQFLTLIGPYLTTVTLNGQLVLEFFVEFMAVGVLALGLIGALVQKKLLLLVTGAWFVARILCSIILGFTYENTSPESLFGVWSWQGWLSLFSVAVAIVGALLSFTLKTSVAQVPVSPDKTYSPETSSADASAPQPTGTAAGWYFDPSVGGQRYWDGSTWLNVPVPGGAAPQGQPGQAAPAPGIAVAAFVLSLLMPLVGLIMGYVARNQARVSANPQAGATLIKAAITIGWIFTALGVVGSIIYGIAMALLLNQSYSY